MHTAAPVGRRRDATLIPPHGGARDGEERDVLRDRSSEIPGTWPYGRRPARIEGPSELSDSEGAVLDPIVAIRQSITIDADESARIDLVTGVARTRDDVFVLIEKYRDKSLADRVFDLAWSHGQVILRQLNASEADAQLFGRLESAILYANPASGEPEPAPQEQPGAIRPVGPGDLRRPAEAHSVREFVELAFSKVGRKIEWRGKGIDEIGIDIASGEALVKIDSRYFRPTEVDLLLGDPAKAHRVLGWQHKVSFPELVSEMVESDLKVIAQESHREHGNGD